MLSKTHLVCGMAVSMAVLQPQTPKEIAIAMLGGALGSSIPDIDIIKNRTNLDSIITQSVAFVLVVAAVFLDYHFNYGILRYMAAHPGSAITGAAMYIALVVVGFYAAHRSFTHSIAAMMLFTVAAGIIYPNITESYLLGYGSHLVLDLLNRKPVQLFYPIRKGVCLKLCYSNRKANKVLFVLGSLGTVGMLAYSIVITMHTQGITLRY